jgi:hypothetical protein
MVSERSRRPPAGSGTLVEDGSGQRPFMRGIMVHSLMARGVSFEEAYRVANLVRDKIRGRPLVRRDELTTLLEGEFGGRLEPAPLPLARPITVVDRHTRTPFSKGVPTNEDFGGAMKIVPELGDPPARTVSIADLAALASGNAT